MNWDRLWLPDGGDILVQRIQRERRTARSRGVWNLPSATTGFIVQDGKEEYKVSPSSVAGDQIEKIYASGAWFQVDGKSAPCGYRPCDSYFPGHVYHVFNDEDNRQIYFANESDYSRHTRGSEAGLWVMWFVNWAPIYVAVWADHLEDALEEGAAFCKDFGIKGAFTEPDYDDARKDLGPNATDEEVYEAAETDLTYTESGWIGSEHWGYLHDPPPAILEAAQRLGRLVTGNFYKAEDDG